MSCKFYVSGRCDNPKTEVTDCSDPCSECDFFEERKDGDEIKQLVNEIEDYLSKATRRIQMLQEILVTLPQKGKKND